jgi:two-component system, LytTR family, response regulator
MIRSVIIDDKLSDRENLRLLLEEFKDEIQIIGYASDVKSGFQLLLEQEVDLVFLDILLDPGTGFEILNALYNVDRLNFQVIFVTAFNTYENAIRALQFAAIDFVEKPIHSTNLRISIDRYKERVKQPIRDQVKLLGELQGQEEIQFPDYLFFQLLKGKIQRVLVSDILFLQGDGSLTRVFLSNGETFVATKNLGQYVRILADSPTFFQVSKSIMLNLSYIKVFDKFTLELKLKGYDGVIKASRRKGSELKSFLKKME